MQNAYVSSAAEVVFALSVSNAAIFVAIFVTLLLKDPASTDVAATALDTFRGAIKTTEVVVYILGFLAPALWVILRNLRAWKHFGFLILLVLIQVSVIVSTSLIYALSMAGVLKNNALASGWAWACLLVALGVWYTTLVYHRKVLLHLPDKVDRQIREVQSGSAVLAGLEAGQ